MISLVNFFLIVGAVAIGVVLGAILGWFIGAILLFILTDDYGD